MWWTPVGERVLRGAEWSLIREAIWAVCDLVEESMDAPGSYTSGVDLFDSLRPGQQLALLAQVGQALFDRGVPAPNPTDYTEAVLMAVYRHMTVELAMEVDPDPELYGYRFGDPYGYGSDDDESPWMRRVLAAFLKSGARPPRRREPTDDREGEDRETGPPWKPPECWSGDVMEWESLVESLAEMVLWVDLDCETEDESPSLGPWLRGVLSEKLGAAEGDLAGRPPDPTDAEVEAARRALWSLCCPSDAEIDLPCDGLWDVYHDIVFGPCDAYQQAREMRCGFIVESGVSDGDQFACTYEEWVELFRRDLYRAIGQIPYEQENQFSKLPPRQVTEARRSLQTGEPMSLEDGFRIEPRGTAWIVGHETGGVLATLEEGIFIQEGEEEGIYAKCFCSPLDALAFFALWNSIHSAEEDRRKLALWRIARHRGDRPSRRQPEGWDKPNAFRLTTYTAPLPGESAAS